MSNSRLEGILDGSYTGKPLSRLEQLFADGAGGSGGGITTSQMNSAINDAISTATTSINASVDSKITEALEEFEPSGGNGSGIVKEARTSLFKGSQLASTESSLTLSESISNYDKIRIRAYYTINSLKIWKDFDYDVKDFVLGDDNDQHYVDPTQEGFFYFWVNSTGTQLNVKSATGNAYWGEVIGIKMASVDVTLGVERETVLCGPITTFSTAGVIAHLNQSIKNFDKIRIEGYMIYGNEKIWGSPVIYNVSEFDFEDIDHNSYSIVTLGSGTQGQCGFYLNNTEGTELYSRGGDRYELARVVGINIVPINDPVYVDDYEWVKLFDISNADQATISSGIFDLSDDITNYSELLITPYFDHDSENLQGSTIIPVDDITINVSKYNLISDGSHVATIGFPAVNKIRNISNSGSTYIYRVYGHKKSGQNFQMFLDL